MAEIVNGKRPLRKGQSRKANVLSGRPKVLKNDVYFSDDGKANLSWSNRSALPPHRIVPGGDASFTPFPVHVSYPLEPFQFSLFSPVYSLPPTAPYCPVPPKRKGRKSESQSETKPASSIVEQQYASLPPVNIDVFSPKSSDSDSNSKRHYSDPGLGPVSSDESETSSLNNPLYINLMEEVRDLKEKFHNLSSQIVAMRQIKTADVCHKCSSSFCEPGSVVDAVGELRFAVKECEQAIVNRVQSEVDAAEKRYTQNLNALVSRIDTMESNFATLESLQTKATSVSPADGAEVTLTNQTGQLGSDGTTTVSDAFVMVQVLEGEKLELERKLQLALHSRSQAEANNQKLERLVSILRTKIKGLSAEACISEEIQARPMSLVAESSVPTNIKVGPQSGDAADSSSSQHPKNKSSGPPSIPPRPAAFSSPRRTSSSPPNYPSQISELSSTPVANFHIGKAVNVSAATAGIKHVEPENSTASLGATLTISGPVTDL